MKFIVHVEGEQIGQGHSRTVYALGPKFVIKYAGGWVREVYAEDGQYEKGKRCNLIEAERWQKISESDKAQHFAAVIGTDPQGEWVIMERLEENWNASDPYPQQPVELLNIGMMFDVYDTCAFNSARNKDGTWKIVDYAG